MSDYFDNLKRKRDERIMEFSEFGIEAEGSNGYLGIGSINFTAREAEKILKLLRKGKREQ